MTDACQHLSRGPTTLLDRTAAFAVFDALTDTYQLFTQLYRQLQNEAGAALDPRSMLCLLLVLETTRHEGSAFYPYIAALPETYGMCCLFLSAWKAAHSLQTSLVATCDHSLLKAVVCRIHVRESFKGCCLGPESPVCFAVSWAWSLNWNLKWWWTALVWLILIPLDSVLSTVKV